MRDDAEGRVVSAPKDSTRLDANDDPILVGPSTSATFSALMHDVDATTSAMPFGKGRAGARWSLVQDNPAPLDIERVRTAFQRSGHLTSSDAAQMVNNAYGVLVDGLSADEAAALQGLLADVGIHVAIIAATALELPRIRNVTRMEIDDDSLRPFDHYGRRARVPWSSVLLVACGAVPGRPRQQRTDRRARRRTLPGLGRALEVGRGSVEPEAAARPDEAILDFGTLDPPQRFRATASSFVFSDHPQHKSFDREAAFVALVRETLGRADAAALTEGAAALHAGAAKLRRYRSERLYEREQSWCLWSRASTRS